MEHLILYFVYFPFTCPFVMEKEFLSELGILSHFSEFSSKF